MLYFDHDTSAADDDKIVVLRDEHGGAAVDAYWTILERIYKDETDLVFGKNQVQTKALTRRLGLGFDDLQTYISAFFDIGLLEDVATDEQRSEGICVLHSKRASDNIAAYNERKETARRNGSKGGRKPKANRTLTKSVSNREPTANQDLTQPKTNKRKVKEKKRERVERIDAPHAQILDASDHISTGSPDQGFEPPSLDEVRAYFSANCLKGDPELYYATYDAKGWVDGSGFPIVKWTSQALKWSKRQVEFDAERTARGEPTTDEAKWKPASNEDPEEAYERERRRYAELYGEEALAEYDRERGLA